MGQGSFWQGLLDWWKPLTADSGGPPVLAEKAQTPILPEAKSSSGWHTRHLVSGGGVLRSVDFDSPENKPATIREAGAHAESVSVLIGEDLNGGVTEAELRDFLAADDEPVEADPAFKHRLREQLWAMIQEDDLPKQ